jgi:translation initiation factor IF-2
MSAQCYSLGIVVGFNIKAHRQTMATAQALHVPILLNNVIYRLIDEIKGRVIDMLPKLYDSRVLGEATIQQIFKYTIKGSGQKTIAGCRVGNGTMTKKAKIKVQRGKETVFEGKSLMSEPIKIALLIDSSQAPWNRSSILNRMSKRQRRAQNAA